MLKMDLDFTGNCLLLKSVPVNCWHENEYEYGLGCLQIPENGDVRYGFSSKISSPFSWVYLKFTNINKNANEVTSLELTDFIQTVSKQSIYYRRGYVYKEECTFNEHPINTKRIITEFQVNCLILIYITIQKGFRKRLLKKKKHIGPAFYMLKVTRPRCRYRSYDIQCCENV
jgi:hypothetical protein